MPFVIFGFGFSHWWWLSPGPYAHCDDYEREMFFSGSYIWTLGPLWALLGEVMEHLGGGARLEELSVGVGFEDSMHTLSFKFAVEDVISQLPPPPRQKLLYDSTRAIVDSLSGAIS